MSKILSTPWWIDSGLDGLCTLVLKAKARCHEACLKEQKKTLMYLVCAALDVLRSEEGQLFEVWVLGPHGLGDHLSQLHSSQCRTEPAVTGQHINTGLDQTNRLKTQHMGQIYTQESNSHSNYTCMYMGSVPGYVFLIVSNANFALLCLDIFIEISFLQS